MGRKAWGLGHRVDGPCAFVIVVGARTAGERMAVCIKSAASAGRGDYVVISDFTVGQDRLQLDGAASNYYLGASGVAGVTGIGLYAEQGATDELIAVIRASTTLTASNTIGTAVFV